MSLVSVSSLTKDQKARREWYKEIAAIVESLHLSSQSRLV